MENPDQEQFEVTEEIAQAITDLSKGAHKLLNGKLKRRAIIILLQDSTKGKIPIKHIEYILNALLRLKEYVR